MFSIYLFLIRRLFTDAIGKHRTVLGNSINKHLAVSPINTVFVNGDIRYFLVFGVNFTLAKFILPMKYLTFPVPTVLADQSC